jgi:hypothetical protein
LRESVPSMQEIFYGSFFERSISLVGQSQTVTYDVDVNDVSGLWNVVPVVKYDCLFEFGGSGYFCTEEVGPEFRIVKVNELLSWNYNRTTSSAETNPIVMYQSNCSGYSNCDNELSYNKSLCQFCEYGNL